MGLNHRPLTWQSNALPRDHRPPPTSIMSTLQQLLDDRSARLNGRMRVVKSSKVFKICCLGISMHHNKLIPVSIYYVMTFSYSIYTEIFDEILCEMTLAATTIWQRNNTVCENLCDIHYDKFRNAVFWEKRLTRYQKNGRLRCDNVVSCGCL